MAKVAYVDIFLHSGLWNKKKYTLLSLLSSIEAVLFSNYPPKNASYK